MLHRHLQADTAKRAPMFEVVLVLSPERPLDGTGWLDYVCLAGLVLYYALAVLCTLFVVVNVMRRNMDVTILGWPGLLMIIAGSCLDLTSEFVTNGHLELLERVRTVDCHTWDYWVKFVGLGAFFSGLCLCMVKSSALVYTRLQRALSAFEARRRYTGNMGIRPARACATGDMEEVELDQAPAPPLQPPQEAGCFCLGFGWAMRAAWSRMNPASRLWALAAVAVTVILTACVFMVAASYLPGATVEVEEADTCYTSIYFKAMFLAVMAIFLAAGWAIYMATAHTDIRAPLARMWRARIAPVLAWCFEAVILFLDKGVYVLGNPVSLALFRAAAPLYLHGGGRRFITSPRRFMRVSRIYALRTAHRVFSRLPSCCGLRERVAAAHDGSDEVDHGYLVDSEFRGVAQDAGFYFHAVAPSQAAPAALAAPLAASQSLTGASFGLALAAISVGLALRVFLNVMFLVSYMGGRALYFGLTEASYLVSLSAVLGNAYMCRLRGLSPTADTVEAHAQAVPETLDAAAIQRNNRVLVEFFAFTTNMVKHAERSVGGRELVCLFSWHGMRNSSSFLTSFQDDVPRYVSTELVPRDSVEEHAGPEHVSGADADGDFPYDDAVIIYLPHVVDFLRAYFECKSRFAEAMDNVVVPSHVGSQLAFMEEGPMRDATRQELRAACDRLYESLLGKRFHFSRNHICEEAAVPLVGNRKVIIVNTQRNSGGITPELIRIEFDMAIAILGESVWVQYAHAPETMTWLRVAKAHADSEKLRTAQRYSDAEVLCTPVPEEDDQFDF